MSEHRASSLGFLGYGNMGSAILARLITTKLFEGAPYVYDPSEESQRRARELGAVVVGGEAELARHCTSVLLAVKPQTMTEALGRLKEGLTCSTLFISVAAGISIASIEGALGPLARVVRVMPNTPALVGAGAACFATGANCTQEDPALVQDIFDLLGFSHHVEETKLDAVTGISGSGPAYFFYLTEALAKAGVAAGLDAALAERLAAETLYGAGQLLKNSTDAAAVLRQRVTSKGGTTEAAIRSFEAAGLERIVQEAVGAAVNRSRELGAQ